jgi:hypothetical protein
MNSTSPRAIALALLVAFTFARAALADTYEDAQSGVGAYVPDGFKGTHMHRKNTDVFMKSDEIEAGISVFAGTFGKAEVERALRDLPLDKAVKSGDVITTLVVYEERIVALAALQGGRMAVLVARPQGLAIGSFVGHSPTDAHVTVVDAVAKSIQARFVENLRFDVPLGYEEGANVEGAEVTYYDRKAGRFIVVADDRTDVTKPYEQQVVDAVQAGLLGENIEATVRQQTVRSPAKGILQVDIVLKSGGVPMAGIITRAALPGRPMWIVTLGTGNEPDAQQAIANFVAASMARKTVVASR